MRPVDVGTARRVLAMYRDTLRRLLALGPESSAPADVRGFGNVRRTLRRRIRQWEARAARVGVEA